MLGIISVVTILACVQALPSNVVLENTEYLTPKFNSIRRIALDGYFSESHSVITRDGYILEINRIPNPRFTLRPIEPGTKPVVFLMHGLQSSALAYIAAGPRLAIAYILADAGYDVWMANARGINQSRRHLWLNPDNRDDAVKFFDYTFDDVGTKDLPAMIDYVLRITNQEKLSYIGHSQGGTAFLVLNSLMPEYNKKFVTAHLLAGVGYQDYFPNDILTAAAQKSDQIFDLAVKTGIVELFGVLNRKNEMSECAAEDSSSAVCGMIAVIDTIRGIFAPLESVAGASIKQYAHFGQNIRDRTFRRWNYNILGNLWVYGSIHPPAYDLSLIDVDLTMHYTVGDVLLDERDVLNMATVLPKVQVRRVARDSFSHFDFVLAPDSRELVTDYVVEKLNEKNNL